MPVGVANTSSIHMPADYARKSFAGMITRLFPAGQAPLFGLTSMLKSETAVQQEHGFFTKTMIFPSITLTGAGQASGDTTLTCLSTANVIPGMMFRHDVTGENIIINAVISPTQVTAARGVGTIGAAAMGASTSLFMIGNAFEQSSLRPQALSIAPVRITNFTQIFRNTWALSNSMRATQVIAGDSTVAENRQDCALFHAVDIEKALFWGQKFQGSRNGQPFSLMDGLINLVVNNAPANITTFGATTNFTQMETAMDPLFNVVADPRAPNERILFVGGVARRVITAIGRLNGQYQIMDGQTSFGLQFSQFKIARGKFTMIEHPLFNAFGTASTWARMAVAVDLSTFNVAYLGDRRTESKEFNASGRVAQDNGIDAVGGTLTTELTCTVKNPAAFGDFYNFTAGAAG